MIWFSDKRFAHLRAQVDELRDEVTRLAERVDHVAAAADACEKRLERESEDMRQLARAIEDGSRQQGRLADTLAQIDRRVDGFAERAGPERIASIDDAVASVQLALARVDRRFDLQREDFDRAIIGIMERLVATTRPDRT